MKIPLSLLKKYVDIEDLSVEKISNILTLAGLEVEQIENLSPHFSSVIAAKIISVKNYDDKFKIARVSDEKNIYQVVSTAKNCRENILVAYAKEGALLNGIKIGKKKILGIESFGMLCSRKDLSLAKSSSGIMELENIEPGRELKELLDPTFEISLTPNLGHCMSVFGTARELAALLNRKVTPPPLFDKKLPLIPIKISIEDKKNCPRYSALLIENVEIRPSPPWLVNYLELSDIRSVNNIVDILNFVMLEMGQPFHAFDIDKVDDNIVVTSLKKSENFISLDGEERKLAKDTLVIKDSKKTIAVAGIIGGKNSEVTEETKNILIESADFNFLPIRKTSRALSLRSESSSRFERGIDREATLSSLMRAAYLIKKELKDAKISGYADIKEEKKREKISIRISRTNRILGTKLAFSEIDSILKRIDIKREKKDSDTLVTEVPSYRNDLKTEIDLIEEVARIYGYNNIKKEKTLFQLSDIPSSPLYMFEKQLKDILLKLGMQEIITSDLISDKLASILDESPISKSEIIEVMHAKSKEQSILRPSFLPSLLQVAKHNHNNKNFDFAIFEVGRVHFKKEKDFLEQPTTAIMLSGYSSPHYFDPKNREADFFDLKGLIENLITSLHIKNIKYKRSKNPSFHPKRQTSVYIEGDIEVGVIGELHPNILSKLDIKKDLYFAELNNLFLLEYAKEDIKFRDFSKFPSSYCDLTIDLEKKLEIEKIFDKIYSIKEPLLKSFSLLDIYVDPKIKNRKKATFRFIYGTSKKTISSEEVEKAHNKITKMITTLAKSLDNS